MNALNRLHGLYDHSPIRFLAVGLSNFVLTYGVFLGVLSVAAYPWAFGAAFVAGMLFTAVLNIHHTFARRTSATRVAVYGAYYGTYALINLGLIAILVESVGVVDHVAFLATQIMLVPLHYVLSKRLIERIAPVRRSG